MRTSALVLSTTCTATQQCIILATTNITSKTNTSTIAGVVTVTAVLIRTPVGATDILHPASVRITAIASLSLHHVIQSQSLTVSFIMTYTSALVLSIACTATQECMIFPTRVIKTNINAVIITVTAVEI